jgi:hypothetical protein
MGTPNPKSETRNPKQIRNSKSKGSKRPGRAVLNIFPLDFEFVSDFEFRISDFGFRALDGGADKMRPAAYNS